MKRVLITNNTLGTRAGSEMYVLDIATALLEEGWLPMAFSTDLGEVAEELRSLSIPVVSDPAALPFMPDLIHAHHHLDAMAAIQQFPGVPVIYYCHGWLPWEEMPLKHPQIYRYIAVDELCRERLEIEHGISCDQIELLLNFVDMRKYQPRSPLPQKPRRALVFSNGLHPGHPVYDALAKACEMAGISLELAGMAANQAHSQPELLLPEFDLVFAKARCALEALAVGCAVIVSDRNGLGGMVTPDNLDYFRPLNFGYRTLRRNPTPTPEQVLREISRYDASSCEAVSLRIRCEADRTKTVQHLIAMYEEALLRSPARGPGALPTADQKATAAYLLSLARDTKQVRSAVAAIEPLRSHIAVLEAQLAASLTREKSATGELQSKIERISMLEEQTSSLKENIQGKIERIRLLERKTFSLKEKVEAQMHRLHRFKGIRRFLPRWLAAKL